MTQIPRHVMTLRGLYNEQGFIPVLLAVMHGSLHMLHSQVHAPLFHLCKSSGMGRSVTLWQHETPRHWAERFPLKAAAS